MAKGDNLRNAMLDLVLGGSTTKMIGAYAKSIAVLTKVGKRTPGQRRTQLALILENAQTICKLAESALQAEE